MRNILSILWVALIVPHANATVVQIDDLSDMVQNADVIAQVVVKNSQTVFEAGRLVELTNVDVVRGLKGVKNDESLTIRQVQGIIGQSQYHPGEEAIFFGMRYEDKVVSYGVGLGKFRVIRDKDASKVVEDFRELLAVKREMGALHVTEPVARFYPSLGDFISKIEQAENAPWRLVKIGPKAVRKR